SAPPQSLQEKIKRGILGFQEKTTDDGRIRYQHPRLSSSLVISPPVYYIIITTLFGVLVVLFVVMIIVSLRSYIFLSTSKQKQRQYRENSRNLSVPVPLHQHTISQLKKDQEKTFPPPPFFEVKIIKTNRAFQNVVHNSKLIYVDCDIYAYYNCIPKIDLECTFHLRNGTTGQIIPKWIMTTVITCHSEIGTYIVPSWSSTVPTKISQQKVVRSSIPCQNLFHTLLHFPQIEDLEKIRDNIILSMSYHERETQLKGKKDLFTIDNLDEFYNKIRQQKKTRMIDHLFYEGDDTKKNIQLYRENILDIPKIITLYFGIGKYNPFSQER
ncbi:hypothetical protein EBS02_11370, partial [bacterium]|nr:hypothetical protein [bacterium]